MLIVNKFGGSSLADAEKLLHAAKLCAEEQSKGHMTAVVVSARGSYTDELENTAHEISPSPPLRERDAFLSTGEMQSAALMAMQLRELGIPACSLTGAQAGILTDSRHGAAEIISIDCSKLRSLMEAGILPVICGFQGADADGNITTLGRGGSDTTAAALAGALKADVCRIYTDVDGVYTADPRTVPQARLLQEIDYSSMLKLAESGAQVLHPRSVRLAMHTGINLMVQPAGNDSPGTKIAALPAPLPFAGIACDTAASAVTVVGTLADGEQYENIINALSDSGITVKSGETGAGYIKITVAADRLRDAAVTAHKIMLAAE